MSAPRPAVKALIERDGQYLLLKQFSSHGTFWTLPGGKIEFDESPREALRREVEEETGLLVKVDAPTGMYDFKFDQTHIIVTVLECRLQSDSSMVDIDSNPADELIVDHQWVAKVNLTDRSMNDGLERLLDSLVVE